MNADARIELLKKNSKKLLTKLSIRDRLNIQSIDDRQKEGINMDELKLGMVEGRFADIVWENQPVSTKDLVKLCDKELNWKRTTTYTVLKKLCERGIFKTENSVVRALISRDEFYAIQSEKFVDETFKGSLPAFIAAFSSRKKLSADELSELQRLIDSFGKEQL
jgi:predicted transcriptional regulator